jgi:hypothetical protein
MHLKGLYRWPLIAPPRRDGDARIGAASAHFSQGDGFSNAAAAAAAPAGVAEVASGAGGVLGGAPLGKRQRVELVRQAQQHQPPSAQQRQMQQQQQASQQQQARPGHAPLLRSREQLAAAAECSVGDLAGLAPQQLRGIIQEQVEAGTCRVDSLTEIKLFPPAQATPPQNDARERRRVALEAELQAAAARLQQARARHGH